MPLFFARGAVYVVRFLRFESPRTPIEKFLVCLQQGRIVDRRDTFTAVVMNSCKDNQQPAQYPWSIFVSPDESRTEFGAVVNCSEVHTVLKADVLDYTYSLSSEMMARIDKALMYAIGLATIEEAEERFRNRTKLGP